MNLFRYFLCLFILFLSFPAIAQIVTDTLYINRGIYTAVDGNVLPYIAFNNSSIFSAENARFHLSENDSLVLTIINNDSVLHGFEVKDVALSGINIPADDTVTTHLKFWETAAYVYFDPLNYPNHRYLGLGGMIAVDGANSLPFYWNIKEHNAQWNDSIANGNVVNWGAYDPDYFTINSNSNPDINSDPSARVEGNVGDTIRIYITNTGQSVHSLHFHGYHCSIIYSSKSAKHTGWEKDTFPVYSMETYILEMVPDKPGEYPVHDHNLVAVSAAGLYPNGMFLTMLIQ